MRADITRLLAEFAAGTRYEELPAETRRMTCRALADALGVMLGATSLEPACALFARTTAQFEPGPCTLLGSTATGSVLGAAASNGALAHALDFEDAHSASLTHPNAAAIPAALAVAELTGGVTGQQLVAALTVGSEVVCRLGAALGRDPLSLGWYIPPMLGAFGATASAGQLLRLDAEQMTNAFGFCLYQTTCSAEFLNTGGSVLRAIRDGFSARAGVYSALLAREGLISSDRPLEGRAGFFAQYSGGEFNSNRILSGLGKTFLSTELSFKAWPSCRGTHPFIQAALSLRARYTASLEDVTEIVIEAGDAAVTLALLEPLERKRRPTVSIDAKFSIPFCVATAFVHGEVSLFSFSQAALEDERVRALAARITYRLNSNPEVPVDVGRGSLHLVSAQSRDSAAVTSLYGNPDNPISDEDLERKFLVCAALARPKLKDEQSIHLYRQSIDVETLADVRDLLGPLRGLATDAPGASPTFGKES